MLCMDDKFKVRLTIAQWPSRTAVFYKPDGQRFLHLYTLKVRANHKYVVEAVVTPASRILTGMRILGQTILLTSVRDRQRKDMTRYSGVWCTLGYDVNKDKTRTQVPLVLEFNGEAILMTTVQCKVYPGDDNGGHYQWGQAFYSIDIQCKAPPGGVLIDAVDEKFITRRRF